MPNPCLTGCLMLRLFLFSKLLVNGANLLFDIHALKMTDMRLALTIPVAVEAVDGGLFPPGELVLGHGQTSDGIKDVAALASESLQVVCHVDL